MVDNELFASGQKGPAGQYKCAECSYIFEHYLALSLPPCPKSATTPHFRQKWLLIESLQPGITVQEQK